MDRHEDDNTNDARFERELSSAMRRVNAPETLERFLLLAAQAEEHRKASGKSVARQGRILAFPTPRLWFGGAMAAMLTVAMFAGESVHRHREHAEANREFDQAQQITDRTLEHTREQLQRQGISLDPY
jgi:hypothetical protein